MKRIFFIEDLKECDFVKTYHEDKKRIKYMKVLIDMKKQWEVLTEFLNFAKFKNSAKVCRTYSFFINQGMLDILG